MTNTTQKGRILLSDLWTAGATIETGSSHELAQTLSLIARHAKTARNITEIECSGHPVFGGEWVNTHYEWLEKRDQQIERRLAELAKKLPHNVRMETNGDPRGWVVRLVVTDEHGYERTVGVD